MTLETGVKALAEAVAVDVKALDDGKVDKVEGKELSANNFTDLLHDKLIGLEGTHWRGTFVSVAELEAGVTDPQAGDYADVNAAGENVQRHIWDATNQVWVAMSGEVAPITASQVKQLYESNPDTNAFTNDEKAKLADIEVGATKNRADSLNADKSHTHTMEQVVGLPDVLLTKFDKANVAQSVGQSAETVMSQKATTDALANIPSVPKTADYTVTAADKGASIDTTANVTLPASVFAVGDVIVVTNTDGADITITPATGVTLRLAGSDTSGLRTLTGYGVATLRMVSNNVWFASGAGLA